MMDKIRDFLEGHQVKIYFMVIALGVLFGLLPERTVDLEYAINPALALMLFVTFLQVPLIEMAQAFKHLRFIAALLVSNFIVIPLLVAALSYFLPADPLIRFAVLFVLLAPCVDYVITFTHIGQGNARLLLAMTPILLLVQMLILPIYLGLFLDTDLEHILAIQPFLQAFLWFIVLPLIGAALVQFMRQRSTIFHALSSGLSLLPVPATALVLFLVLSSIMPQIGLAQEAALQVLPIYIVYAVCAPLLARGLTQVFQLETGSAKAVGFSASYRNSLIIMPLALAVPGGMPIVPAVILTQTIVELCFLPIYLFVMPKIFKAYPSVK